MPLIRSARSSSESIWSDKVPPQAEAHSGDDVSARIRVVVAMSGELERLAWSLIVRGQRDMELIAEVSSCEEVLSLLNARAADVTLIDEAVLGSDRFSDFQRCCKHPSSSRLVFVTLHSLLESPELTPHSFIHSYLLKGASGAEVMQAIRAAASTPSAETLMDGSSEG